MSPFELGAVGLVAIVIVDRFLKYMLAAKLQVPTDIQQRLERIESKVDLQLARVRYRLKRLEQQSMNGDTHPSEKH